MATVTQPLRDEHRDLMPQIDALQTLADKVGKASAGEILRDLDQSLAFLAHHLLVHAQAEEQVLYPAIAQLYGADAATATMKRDHAAIAQMTTALRDLRPSLNSEQLTAENQQALRRLLYGLHTLVRVHLAKEEEVFLPKLDAALSPEEGRDLFARMENTAHALMDRA